MAIVLILMILALGTASLLGRTPDSRDPDYGMAGLIGRTPAPAEPADRAKPAETVRLTVPAAWLTVPLAAAR